MDKTHKWKMRLIDADELCADRVSNDPVVIAAKCAPTIDAEPVRHGEWLFVEYSKPDAWYCSECSVIVAKQSFYCPHCGAKMYGGVSSR